MSDPSCYGSVQQIEDNLIQEECDMINDTAAHSPNYSSQDLLADVSIVQDVFSRSLTIHRNLNSNKITKLETFVHFIKGNLGSGFFSMPFAMSLVGLAVGPPILCFVGLLGLFCMFLIVKCADTLGRKYNSPGLGYGDVVQLAFKDYFNNDGRMGRYLIDSFLVVSQLGFCSVYFILIAQNIKSTVENYNPHFVIGLKVYIVVLLVFVMLSSFIWRMKTLALFSMLGNVFVFTGLILIFVYIFRHAEFTNLSPLYVGHLNNLPIFLGMAVYAMEGIGLVLPLRNQMEEPAYFPLILTLGMCLITLGQVLFGVLGYICFREHVLAIITFNLPNGIIGTVATLCVAFCVYLTYPLILYVPVEILLPPTLSTFSRYSYFSVQFWLRTSLVLVTFLFAVLIPHIDLFIALIGALASCSLALIFPPVSYLMVHRATLLDKLLCVFIIAVGVTCGIVGTLYATKDIVCALCSLPTGGPFPCKPPPS